MKRKRVGWVAVALAVGMGVPAVGASVAYADSGSGGPAAAELAEAGSSVGGEILGTGSGIASEGVGLLLPAVGLGSSSAKALAGLLSSGSTRADEPPASASPGQE